MSFSTSVTSPPQDFGSWDDVSDLLVADSAVVRLKKGYTFGIPDLLHFVIPRQSQSPYSFSDLIIILDHGRL